jgi:hypothetical protein
MLRTFTCIFITVLGVLGAPCLRAQDDRPLEYHVKAVFLYNFANFVEWPEDEFADSTAPFVFGIYGEDPFGSALEEVLEGENIEGRRIEIRQSENVSDILSCQIVYAATDELSRLNQLIEETRGRSILSVGDADGFARSGGIIEFIDEENKVRFLINMDNAESAGLKVSSRLQKVAREVIRDD